MKREGSSLLSTSVSINESRLINEQENEGETLIDEDQVSVSRRDLPNVFVFTLVILFGLSSWIVVNGLYTALPLLMIKLPEKFELAAYMNFALQLANIFPFLFFIFTSLVPWRKLRWHIDTVVICGLILIGIASCTLMIFLWDHTSIIGGKKMSFAFLSLVFVTGAVDTTSSVVYWPFISNYKYYYTTALSIGEALTGLIAGIIGLIMQPGPNPLFPFPVFVSVLVGILVLSGVAFLLLRFLPYCKTQMVQEADLQRQIEIEKSQYNISEEERRKELKNVHYKKIVLTLRLVFMQALISFVQNGLLVATGPYVFHAYPKSSALLRYSILISQILDPFFCFLAYVFPFYNLLTTLFVHLTWIILSSLLFTVAIMNPHSPKSGSLGMGIGLVVVTILNRSFVAFGKTSEWLLVHKQMKRWRLIELKEENTLSTTEVTSGRKYLKSIEMNPFRLAGIGIQSGALIGAIIMILLTKYHVLHDGY